MAECHRAQIERAKAGPTPGRPGRRRQVPPLPLSARAQLIHSRGGQPVSPGRLSRHRDPAGRFVSGPAGSRGAHSSARPGSASPHRGLAAPPRPRAPRGPGGRGRSRPQVRASPGPAAPPGHGVAGLRAPAATPLPAGRPPIPLPKGGGALPSPRPRPGLARPPGEHSLEHQLPHAEPRGGRPAAGAVTLPRAAPNGPEARPLQLRNGFRCTSLRTRRRPGRRQTFSSRRRDGAAAQLPPPLRSPPLPPLPACLEATKAPEKPEARTLSHGDSN
eukprot:XP_013973449.1 basic salivary proline-rich protein 4-like [Canis lupus familiaris]